LKGFASRQWLSGLLDPARIATTNYFGGNKHKDGKMAGFVNKKVAKYSPEQKENLKKVIAAVSAEAKLKSQRAQDQRDADDRGRARFAQRRHQLHGMSPVPQQDEDTTGRI
jgi:ubiquinol-cytochrome c reductase cytochrome b subunit